MKKWFIYVTDHHEGPFTVEEIRQGISEGKFPAAGFIWAQGMSDWLPMNAVPDFNEAPPAPPMSAPPPEHTGTRSQQVSVSSLTGSMTGSTTGSMSRGGMTDEILSSSSPAMPVEESHEPSQPIQPIEPERTLTTIVEVSDGFGRPVPEGFAKVKEGVAATYANTGFGSTPAPAGFGFKKPILIILLVAGVLYGLSKMGYLSPLEDRLRGAMVSIPELPDLAPEERADLIAAAKTSLSSGPAVALAVSRADPLSPAFYVASNMPDGTKFDLHLEGVGHTLLNTLEFSGKTEATLSKNLGKTPGYRAPDGRVVPRGEYRIFVVEAQSGHSDRAVLELAKLSKVSRELPSSVPGDRRIVFEKVVFLGQKDASYTERLAKFHEQLKQKAQSELMELKQQVLLLKNQHATSVATFERLKKQKLGVPQARAWKQMESNWTRLDAQLSSSLSKLSPETMNQDYVYGNVYLLMASAQKKLREIHSFQAMYFDKKISLSESEDQISKVAPEYEKMIVQLDTTIASIDQDPVDSQGLPKKAVIR